MDSPAGDSEQGPNVREAVARQGQILWKSQAARGTATLPNVLAGLDPGIPLNEPLE